MATAFSTNKIPRRKIVETARSWLGTPYRHQASVRGAGTDCLGLLRGVYAELCGEPSEQPPPYQPDWYDVQRDDLLLRKAFEYLEPVDLAMAGPGDVLVFRMRKDMAAKHCGIMVYEGRMVHAMLRKDVEEITVTGWYERHIVGAFRFPGAGD